MNKEQYMLDLYNDGLITKEGLNMSIKYLQSKDDAQNEIHEQSGI